MINACLFNLLVYFILWLMFFFVYVCMCLCITCVWVRVLGRFTIKCPALLIYWSLNKILSIYIFIYLSILLLSQYIHVLHCYVLTCSLHSVNFYHSDKLLIISYEMSFNFLMTFNKVILLIKLCWIMTWLCMFWMCLYLPKHTCFYVCTGVRLYMCVLCVFFTCIT